MSDSVRPVSSPGIHKIGGFLLGAFTGILILAAILKLIEPGYPDEEARTILVFAVVGSPVAILIGGGAGIFYFRFVHYARNPKRFLAISLVLYLIAVASGFLLFPALDPVAEELARIRQERRIDNRIRNQETDREKAWQENYEKRFPRNEDSLTEILGPLVYPDAFLVDWQTEEQETRNGGREFAWEIEMTTTDHLDKVLAYYMTVLPEGISGYPMNWPPSVTFSWTTTSMQQRLAEDLTTRVALESTGTAVTIRYRVTHPKYIKSKPTPWQHGTEKFLKKVRKEQELARAEIRRKLGESIYPGSTLAWASLHNSSSILYETEDPLDQVLTHFIDLFGEPIERDDQYIFKPEYRDTKLRWFAVYSVGDKVRIHY